MQTDGIYSSWDALTQVEGQVFRLAFILMLLIV